MTAIESTMMWVGFIVCLGASLAVVALVYIWAFDKVLRAFKVNRLFIAFMWDWYEKRRTDDAKEQGGDV